ncbi:DgyrCDS202 [Dimorphilus gyrociliatus]|uniref:NOC3-like protein n=1 Tax=Dimorphilus gyrociliatus TaxID=2664684 RepID=A0A7I8V3W3_9ANNE|nr:DgyrCDS202 [Dimorphilus gyrociliatus]
MKRKAKSFGKRKQTKVSAAKLSNKHLNKLAKQGKLKKKLPKNKLIRLLKERINPNAKPEEQRDTRLIEPLAEDIPLQEADYEFFDSKNRNLDFLSAISTEQNSNKRKRKKKKDEVENDSNLEDKYESRRLKQPRLETKALLPIKTSRGLKERTEEVEVEEHEESDAEEKDNTEEEKVEIDDEIGLSSAQIYALRAKKVQAIKINVAKLSLSVIENPEENIKSLRELTMMLDTTHYRIRTQVYKIVLLSLSEIYKDITPGYRIRRATSSELRQKAKKETKKLWSFEDQLLNLYKKFLDVQFNLMRGQNPVKKKKSKTEEKDFSPEDYKTLKGIALQCLGEMLVNHPHFNFRTEIISTIVPVCSISNAKMATTACEYIKKLFKQDKSGEVTLEAVRFIGRVIKKRNFNIHPRILNVFLSLRLSESIIKESQEKETKEERLRKKKAMSKRERKRQKNFQELEKQLEEAGVEENNKRKGKIQTETIQLVFLTYFRILKFHVKSNLLAAVLEGLAKFAHLINLDFFDDLFNLLKQLIEEVDLGLTESLHCIHTAMTILSSVGDTLNIDPIAFYVHLYMCLPKVNDLSKSDISDVLLNCFEQMICKRRKQVPLSRFLSFIKRFSTASLQQDCGVTFKIIQNLHNALNLDSRALHLLQTDNELIGSNYTPESDHPDYCHPESTALYEIGLLQKHVNETIRQYVSFLAGEGSTTAARLKFNQIEENLDERIFNFLEWNKKTLNLSNKQARIISSQESKVYKKLEDEVKNL